MYKEIISDFIDNYRDKMIELLKDFVAIPSIASNAEGICLLEKR